MSKSIWSALRERFAAPEWAYFEEVRNGTGFSRGVTRSADALAFSLWPSRGLELHGIEVKVSRSDWLREKNDPAKAEEIGKFCERWWLVSTEGCVKDKSEIPTAWGWLEFDGKKLVQKKPAERSGAVISLDKPMIAAILRKASESHCALVNQAVHAQVDAQLADERERFAAEKTRLSGEIGEAREEARRATALIRRLEVLLGAPLFTDYPPRPLPDVPPAITEMIGLARQADLTDLRGRLARAAHDLRDAAASARWVLRRAGVRTLSTAQRMRGFG